MFLQYWYQATTASLLHLDCSERRCIVNENMDQGKSQTWFRYAAALVEELNIDHVVKMDSDCLIVLDRF